jgi:hypothetical protein
MRRPQQRRQQQQMVRATAATAQQTRTAKKMMQRTSSSQDRASGWRTRAGGCSSDAMSLRAQTSATTLLCWRPSRSLSGCRRAGSLGGARRRRSGSRPRSLPASCYLTATCTQWLPRACSTRSCCTAPACWCRTPACSQRQQQRQQQAHRSSRRTAAAGGRPVGRSGQGSSQRLPVVRPAA